MTAVSAETSAPQNKPASLANSLDLALTSPTTAKIYGAPLEKLPNDLFIPPDALEIFLDAFEGPLDLLLYLIRKQNLDILDIPMAPLTEQYLAYVEQIRRHNFELASDYLLMAAMLIEIKSRMLLPKPKSQQESENDVDPRAELTRRLIEYEQMKQAAQALDALPLKDRDFFLAQIDWQSTWKTPLPKVATFDLQEAMNAVLRRAALNQNYHISREELSLRAHMSAILKRLSGLSADSFLRFDQLIENEPAHSLAHWVIHFIALLELIRENLIELIQDTPYQPIHLRLTQTIQTVLL